MFDPYPSSSPPSPTSTVPKSLVIIPTSQDTPPSDPLMLKGIELGRILLESDLQPLDPSIYLHYLVPWLEKKRPSIMPILSATKKPKTTQKQNKLVRKIMGLVSNVNYEKLLPSKKIRGSNPSL